MLSSAALLPRPHCDVTFAGSNPFRDLNSLPRLCCRGLIAPVWLRATASLRAEVSLPRLCCRGLIAGRLAGAIDIYQHPPLFRGFVAAASLSHPLKALPSVLPSLFRGFVAAASLRADPRSPWRSDRAPLFRGFV